MNRLLKTRSMRGINHLTNANVSRKIQALGRTYKALQIQYGFDNDTDRLVIDVRKHKTRVNTYIMSAIMYMQGNRRASIKPLLHELILPGPSTINIAIQYVKDMYVEKKMWSNRVIGKRLYVKSIQRL